MSERCATDAKNAPRNGTLLRPCRYQRRYQFLSAATASETGSSSRKRPCNPQWLRAAPSSCPVPGRGRTYDWRMAHQVRYARNGEVAIGYTVLGEGPADLVYLAPVMNLDLAWENPQYARFLRKLASFSRLIIVDRRGTGVSDRYSPDDLPTLEDLVDDLAAVLDAVGSERAALFGFSDAGALCAMFGATRPDRVSGLILHATAASGTQAPDYPCQWSDGEWQEYLRELRDPRTGYGTREYARRRFRATPPRSPAMSRCWNGGSAFNGSRRARAPCTRRRPSFRGWTFAGCCRRSGSQPWSSIGAMTPSSRSARGAISDR